MSKWPENWIACQSENFSRFSNDVEYISNNVNILLLFLLHFSLAVSFHNLFSSRRFIDDHEEGERPSFSSNVSTVLLRFKDKRWECSYMKEPDLMLKYSTFMCLAVLIGIIGIQALNNP